MLYFYAPTVNPFTRQGWNHASGRVPCDQRNSNSAMNIIPGTFAASGVSVPGLMPVPSRVQCGGGSPARGGCSARASRWVNLSAAFPSPDLAIAHYSKHENPREFNSRILAHVHIKHFIKFLDIK